MPETKFWGKYRGRVSDVQDPLMIGRIKAIVPDVLGEDETGWATPCFPFTGQGMGMIGLPTSGAGVWIEFEHGDPDYPIWSGCWLGLMTEMPSDMLVPPPPYNKVIIQTDGGNSILLDDTPGIGGITLKTSAGQKVVLSALGIQIDNGMGASIKMTGPQVSINEDALEVI